MTRLDFTETYDFCQEYGPLRQVVSHSSGLWRQISLYATAWRVKSWLTELIKSWLRVKTTDFFDSSCCATCCCVLLTATSFFFFLCKCHFDRNQPTHQLSSHVLKVESIIPCVIFCFPGAQTHTSKTMIPTSIAEWSATRNATYIHIIPFTAWHEKALHLSNMLSACLTVILTNREWLGHEPSQSPIPLNWHKKQKHISTTFLRTRLLKLENLQLTQQALASF